MIGSNGYDGGRATAGQIIEVGDIIALASKKRCLLIKAEGSRRIISGIGVFDPMSLVGKEYGSSLNLGPNTFSVLRPDLPLIHKAFERKAQIITLKDAMKIVGELGIKNGSRILEIGVGSGFMSAVLLWFCGEEGEVVSYEKRGDFGKVAKKNINSIGLVKRWKLKIMDAKVLDEPCPFDCAVVDIPEPWETLDALRKSLWGGGKVVFYMPTYNQLERCIGELEKGGFTELQAGEMLSRGLTTKRGRIRPEFDMLGHTGFLLFARRV